MKTPRAIPSQAASLLAVLRNGLYTERHAPLTWGGGLGALCALMAALWPSVSDSIGKAIESYPAKIKQVFGIVDLNTVEKYVDAEMLSLIVPLAIAFFAVRCATRAIVGAEENGHLDPLLSLPLSRRVLVAGSYLVTAALVAGILVVMWVLTMTVGELVGAGMSGPKMAAGFANVWPLAMAFAGLAVFAAGFLHRQAQVTAVATSVLVAMYVMNILSKLAPDASWMRNLSAFHYYGSAIQSGLDPAHTALLAAAGALLALVGMEMFERRDVL